MKLPSAEEYVQIVGEKPAGSLASLHNYRFLPGKNSEPVLYEKSRNVIVFKAEFHSQLYAIRFFLNDDHELFRRYHEIQNYLAPRSLTWKVPFEFLHDEYYPSMKMDWIESLSFTEYLDSIITQPFLISQLQSILVSLSRNLEENGIGHGNLNLKHIRFVQQGGEAVLKLIDYDSMFIPSFREKDSLSTGTSSFQHPMRLTSDFSETIDRFSIWVFLTALEAFKTDAALWKNANDYGFDRLKQVLFNYRDLAIPQQSRAFQIIKSYYSEALNFYADKLSGFCSSKTLNLIEAPHLFSPKIAYLPKRNERPVQETRMAGEQKKEKEPERIPALFGPAVTERRKVIPIEKTIEIEENEFVQLKKIPSLQTQKTTAALNGRKRYGLIALVAAAVFIIAFISIYFIKSQNQTPKNITDTRPVEQKASTPLSPITTTQETVFTQANITQFLFGLYQSYNKRDLAGILSNYQDSINRYYDAGAITKNKLSGIIKELFIKPAYYECQPDIRTLQMNHQGSDCKLTIAVTETIQADRRSKKENYSSRIEYTVDRSFKILSERNIE